MWAGRRQARGANPAVPTWSRAFPSSGTAAPTPADRQRPGLEADISFACYEKHGVLHILTPLASKGMGSTESDISQ